MGVWGFGVLDPVALVGVPSNTHESLKPSFAIGERSEDKHGDTVGISRSSEVETTATLLVIEDEHWVAMSPFRSHAFKLVNRSVCCDGLNVVF